MKKSPLPDLAYLRALEIDLFVPYRQLPGAPPHPSYQSADPLHRNRNSLAKGELSVELPRSARKSSAPAVGPGHTQPGSHAHRAASVYISYLHFHRHKLFVADSSSFRKKNVEDSRCSALLENILFARGLDVRTEQKSWLQCCWEPSQGGGQEEMRDYLYGATGLRRLSAEFRFFLFGEEAHLLMPSENNRTVHLPCLSDLLDHPKRKHEVWNRLQKFSFSASTVSTVSATSATTTTTTTTTSTSSDLSA